MSHKLASELQPGDRVCTSRPIGRATVESVRQTRTEIKSRAGQYADALMIIFRVDGEKYDRRALDSDFIHPNDKVQCP